MKLKLDDQGHVVVKDGLPVYVHDDGQESPFDAAATMANVTSLRGEAMRHRKEAKELGDKLKLYEGLDDPEAARAALTKVANLDTKKLVDAGQVDAAVAAALKPYETKLADAEKRAQDLERQVYDEKVGGAFARSKFLAEKTVLPPDLAESAFGKHFKIEEGKLRAYDKDGNPVFSRKTAGAHADFDEAIEILVDAYPRKDSILRATNGSGSGAPVNGGVGNSGAKKSAQMSDAEKGQFIRTNGLNAWNEKVTAEAAPAAA